MNSEIAKILAMTYAEQCKYLQGKYGLPKNDYFYTEECKSKHKDITRTSEGLFIHHNAEWFHNGGNLGHEKLARTYPFEFQKKENLTYCNYLEHLVFHLRINARECPVFELPYEIRYFFNSRGFFFISQEMNDLYYAKGSKTKWRNDCYEVIEPLFEDYVSVLKGVLCFLDDNYIGDRIIKITKGMTLYSDDYELNKRSKSIDDIRSEAEKRIEKRKTTVGDIYTRCIERCKITIADIIPEEDKVELATNGKTVERNLSLFSYEYDYNAIVENYTMAMSALYDKTVWRKLFERLKESFTEEDKQVSRWIKEMTHDNSFVII